MRASKLSSRVALILLATLVARDATTAEPIRIDVSPDNGRRDHLTRGWHNWIITPGREAATTVDGVAFELRASGASDKSLEAGWWKPGLVHGATMTCDGVECETTGLELTIRGLKPGRHTLVTYHNAFHDDEIGPLEVAVTGVTAAVSVGPTHRVADDADAASAYVEFEAPVDGAVIVRVRSATDAGPVVLNGLEIDASDPQKKALKPNPSHGDEHAAERPALAWSPSKSAAAHDVYLGTDAGAVAAATNDSPEYRGRRTEPKFAADAADHFATYYWRVDEVDATGAVTRGDVWRFRVRHLAFPGAEGYGRFARGGRGGRVIKVTNLDDSGPGSLRAAIGADGPRTVVFDVGGRIVLKNRMAIRNPYLTIAGQTAPGNGICIANLNLGMLGTHDVVVRYIRVRPGDTAGLTLDGMGMASTDHSIIDHCSISWTQDEAFSSRAARNITLQRTLISEALNVAGHKNYERGKQHGFAASIGGDVGSFHHNLLAHCAGRNWSLAGGLNQAGRHTGRLDIRNNVVYNWGHRTTDGGAQEVNFVNNYYKPGPASRVFHVLMPERKNVPAFGPQVYFIAGNVMEGKYGPDDPYAGVREEGRERKEEYLVDAPCFEPHVTTQPAAEAYEDVLANVGCNIPALDEHDRRVIEEVRGGTARFKGSISGLPGLPDSQADVGGWDEYPEVHRPPGWDTDNDGMPDEWERTHDFNAADASDGNLDANNDGYTNLEEYLNSIGH